MKRTTELERTIVSLYVNGSSVRYICTYCNISPRSVYCILKANRVRLRKRGPIKKDKEPIENSNQQTKIDSTELADRLRFLRLDCELTIDEMAWLLQVSKAKIDKLLSKFNIKKNQDG